MDSDTFVQRDGAIVPRKLQGSEDDGYKYYPPPPSMLITLKLRAMDFRSRIPRAVSPVIRASRTLTKTVA